MRWLLKKDYSIELEFACNFGVAAIPDRLMNDELMQVLNLYAYEINAYHEFRTRIAHMEPDSDYVYNLWMRMTGSVEKRNRQEPTLNYRNQRQNKKLNRDINYEPGNGQSK